MLANKNKIALPILGTLDQVFIISIQLSLNLVPAAEKARPQRDAAPGRWGTCLVWSRRDAENLR